MEKFFDFIKASPTAYHTVANLKDRLLSEGFCELFFGDEWKLDPGGKYFTVRGGTAIVAFKMPVEARAFMIAASHADSPAFKVKLNEESIGAYVRVPTEKYGGMIMYSWLDRPLSIAGRAVLRTNDGVKTVLVNVDRDLMCIPSIAIHLNRNVNDGYKFNPAKDTVPLLATEGDPGMLREIIASNVGARADDVINHDLFVYVRDEARRVGADGNLILSARLDDLGCVYTSAEAFIAAKCTTSVPVLAVFDNEEVGSATISGADSTFLPEVLLRIAGSEAKLGDMLSSSFAISADNAHAKHPNAPELSDSNNAPVLGGGIVMKYNSNKRYATDGVGAAVFSQIANKAGAKTQSYYNRADMPGGSTLGAILNTQLAVLTADIGLPELAMHSAVETADVRDLSEMQKAVKAFFETELKIHGDDIKIK